MTHEELLEKISNVGAKFEGNAWAIDGGSLSIDGDVLIKNTKALRAVVELHKPERLGKDLINGGDEFACLGCRVGTSQWEYPCPTIQAIEKELNG